MKTILTVLITLLLTVTAIAQQGINYKAVVKDNSGNVVANQSVDIQFTILKGTAQTSVYQETHAPTTDANGIVIVNIGEGTPSQGTFSDIDWDSDDHFLNVKINTGSGLTDMGTTQFMAVPYALNAANVTGLEAIDEGNGIGWRLKGSNPNYYGNIGLHAVDFSYNSIGSSTLGATGYYSTAMGSRTTASGSRSTALGSGTTASGIGSIAMGYNSTASGTTSIAIGSTSRALGDASTSFGVGTTASSAHSTAIGSFNIGGGNPTSLVATDPLFEIGNGTYQTSSNALTVLKNGNIGIDTHTPNSKLQITNGSDVSVTGGKGYLVLGNANGLNIGIDDNEIMARSNGNIATLSLNIEGGEVATGGSININQGVTGAATALKVNGAEALWYNGTYFSYGYGGSANFFNDNVGIGITNPNAKLDVNGNIEYTGSLIDVSDRRLKENLKPITNVLGQLQKIKGYTYNMKDDANKTREYGVIAQDVQKVFPDMVKVIDDKEHLGVSYIQLIPVLLEAIKEQQTEIENLKSQLKNNEQVNQRLEKLEALVQGNQNSILTQNTNK